MNISVSSGSFLERIVQVLRYPSDFFKKEKKEGEFRDMLMFYFGLLLFSVVSMGVASYVSAQGSFDINVVLPILMSYVVYLFAGSFVVSALLFVWMRLFKIKANYKSCYRLFAFSRTPAYLLVALPYVNLLGHLYSFYLLSIGTSEWYGASRKKAFVMFGLAFLVVFVLNIVLVNLASGISFGN